MQEYLKSLPYIIIPCLKIRVNYYKIPCSNKIELKFCLCCSFTNPASNGISLPGLIMIKQKKPLVKEKDAHKGSNSFRSEENLLPKGLGVEKRKKKITFIFDSTEESTKIYAWRLQITC